MRPLQLLIISSLVPTRSRPDVGLFVARQIRLLCRQGLAVRVVVPRLYLPRPLLKYTQWPELSDAQLALPQDAPARRAWYFRPPGAAFTRYEGAAKAPAVRWVARKWHAARPFDVVLGIDMTSDAVAAVRCARDLSIPVANLAIGSDVMLRPRLYPGLAALLTTTLAQTDLPIGVSQATCAALSAAGPCRRTPLCVYLGREPAQPPDAQARAALRAELGFDASDVVAIFVGRLTDEKGLIELGAALETLLVERPRLRLIALGDGPHRAALQALALRAGRPNAILLLGRVTPAQVTRHLAAADFMVFPSRSEGLPQAVLEAMDQRLPVVATRVGGIPEAVLHEQTGLLVAAHDARALQAAMTRMIDDSNFRSAAAAAGFERARSVFDSERNAQCLAEALRELVSAQRSSTLA
ncbi:MAG TPA: glycosyltransferase [Polyangiales bacterium]